MNTRTLKRGIHTLILTTALHGVAGLPGDWQIRSTSFTGNLTGVASAPGQLVAVGHGGTILTLGEDLSWTRVSHALPSGDFYCVTFGKGLYVAGGSLGCLLATSPDGVTWTSIQTTGGQHAHLGITYSGGRFVAVGRGGLMIPSRVISSTNGLDWEAPAMPPTTNILRAVTFGNGKYVAVGDTLQSAIAARSLLRPTRSHGPFRFRARNTSSAPSSSPAGNSWPVEILPPSSPLVTAFHG